MYIDVRLTYRLESAMVYAIFEKTILAIHGCLTMEGLPNEQHKIWKIASAFKISRSFLSPLSGCFQALNGICIAIEKLRVNPAIFFCYKGYHAIPVQARVDLCYKLRILSARCVGSTNDALAHALSEIAALLDRDVLGFLFWIVGDEVHTCFEWLRTPYPNSQAGEEEKPSISLYLPYKCMGNRLLGSLSHGGGILNYKLQFSVGKSARIACVFMKLYNYWKEERE